MASRSLVGVDTDLDELRRRACSDVADWLADIGERLFVGGYLMSERQTQAIALVVQMVGQLGQAAAESFRSEHWYAGAALNRQVVECQYLLTHFRDDPAERERWLDASANRIEKSFRPGQMREAGRFGLNEYKQHCRIGGHPNPSAGWLLPGHARRANPVALVADLALHLAEATVLVTSLAGDLGYPVPALPGSLGEWAALDPLSTRLKSIGSIDDVPAEILP